MRVIRILLLLALTGAGIAGIETVAGADSSVTGNVTTVSSSVNFPTSSLSVSGNGQSLYVTDAYANEIFQLDASTGALRPFASVAGLSNSNRLHVDPFSNVIYEAGNTVSVIDVSACTADCPYGIASMTPGSSYTVEGGVNVYLSRPTDVPATSMTLIGATPLGADASGDLFLLGGSPNEDVFMVVGNTCSSQCPYGINSTIAGDIYWVAGNDYTGGTTDGYSGDNEPATAGLLSGPAAAATDAEGDLLIVDSFANVVRLVAAQSCSTSCAYGLTNLVAGDIYTLAGLGSGTVNDPEVVQGYAPTSVTLWDPNTLGFDQLGDLLIGSNANTNLDLVAAANCSSNCPYGLTSMTEGDLYPLENGERLTGPTITANFRSHDVSVGTVSGSALDDLGGWYLASGTSIYKVSPVVPGPNYVQSNSNTSGSSAGSGSGGSASGGSPAALRPELMTVPHLQGKKTITTYVACSGSSGSCVGTVQLTTPVKKTVHRGKRIVHETVAKSLGAMSFAIYAHTQAQVKVPLNKAGRQDVANSKKHPFVLTETVTEKGSTPASITVRFHRS